MLKTLRAPLSTTSRTASKRARARTSAVATGSDVARDVTTVRVTCIAALPAGEPWASGAERAVWAALQESEQNCSSVSHVRHVTFTGR